MPEDVSRFVVRLYDGMDNRWVDMTEPVALEEAQRVYNMETDFGRHHARFQDIDYYRIFPANTDRPEAGPLQRLQQSLSAEGRGGRDFAGRAAARSVPRR